MKFWLTDNQLHCIIQPMIVASAVNHESSEDMANTTLIYTYIQDSCYKLQYVASVLHISSSTLRHKLLGETQFKLDEAERLSTMLGLTMAERDACFFDAENRFSRSAVLELPKRGKRP